MHALFPLKGDLPNGDRANGDLARVAETGLSTRRPIAVSHTAKRSAAMRLFAAFVAGFLATLIFHQGAIALLHSAGAIPVAAYPVEPTWPFGVPQVISLAFWGGVWGLVLWAIIRNARGLKYWGLCLAVGAVGPTAVAMLVVFPLKGIPVDAVKAVAGLILNGIWGLGTGILILSYFLIMGWLGRRP